MTTMMLQQPPGWINKTYVDPNVRNLLKSVKHFAREVQLLRHEGLAEVTAFDGCVLVRRSAIAAMNVPVPVEFYLDQDMVKLILACPESDDVYLSHDDNGATRLRIEITSDATFPDVASIISKKHDDNVDVAVSRIWLARKISCWVRAGSIVELFFHDDWMDAICDGRALDIIRVSVNCKPFRIWLDTQRLKHALASMRGAQVRIYCHRTGDPVTIYDDTGLTVIQQAILPTKNKE